MLRGTKYPVYAYESTNTIICSNFVDSISYSIPILVTMYLVRDLKRQGYSRTECPNPEAVAVPILAGDLIGIWNRCPDSVPVTQQVS